MHRVWCIAVQIQNRPDGACGRRIAQRRAPRLADIAENSLRDDDLGRDGGLCRRVCGAGAVQGVAEGITGGMGWIAVALVVFATWHPARLILAPCCLV